MTDFTGYRCSLCGTQYKPDEVMYLCPLDGGNLDVLLDFDTIRKKIAIENITASRDFSIWRYLPLLPVAEPGAQGTPLRAVGWTPVYHSHQLQKLSGLPNLWLKDESSNPTASFKDRASALVVARARQIGAEVVVAASTGNAGAALAGMAAAVGQRAVIIAPQSAPQAKIAQLLVYGAQVILITGTYDQAFELAIQAAQDFGWYCRNTGFNPFTIEGKKTAAFEIWETILRRLPPGPRPPAIFVPVGDGNILASIHKGLKDLIALGWWEQMPRLFAVQAAGSAAVINTYLSKGEQIIPVSAHTLADSISVDLPRDGVRAVRAIRQSGGGAVLVSDDEILRAISQMGKAGIFAEPAGAAAYAGMSKALDQGLITPEDNVIVLNTGSGLKDVRAAMQAVKAAPVISPTLSDLKRYLAQQTDLG